MKTIETTLNPSSYAYSSLEGSYILRVAGKYISHTIEWLAPIHKGCNGWELNVLANGKKVNVKAIGYDVYVNDVKVNAFDLKSEVEKILNS